MAETKLLSQYATTNTRKPLRILAATVPEKLGAASGFIAGDRKISPSCHCCGVAALAMSSRADGVGPRLEQDPPPISEASLHVTRGLTPARILVTARAATPIACRSSLATSELRGMLALSI